MHCNNNHLKLIDMFIPEQKTLFISQPNSDLETIYLVDDADIISFLKYHRRIFHGSPQFLLKNVIVFEPEKFFSVLNHSDDEHSVDLDNN